MGISPVPPMTDVPSFPALSERAGGTYNGKAFDFATHMADTFNGELTAVATSAMQNATEAQLKAATAEAAALTATASMQAAIAAVGVSAWVSGQTYQLNTCAISQVNFQTYRRRVAGAGTLDPANDSANWRILAGNGAFVPAAVVGTSIDLRTGKYFTKTVAGAVNLTFDNCPPDGYSFTIELTLTSGSVGLPASVKNANDLALSLQTGKTHLLGFVTSNGGARWRMAVAPNYTT